MIKRLSLTIVVASLLVLAASPTFAGWRGRRCCCHYYSGTSVVHQAAPAASMPHVAKSEAPPTAPAQGETTKNASIEPEALPPAVPVQGTTTRNYSIQPAPVYRSAPSPSAHNPVERRLHPGRGFYQ